MSRWFTHNLEAGCSCTGSTDITVNPVLAIHNDCLYLPLPGSSLAGIYDVAGQDLVSEYEMGVALAEAYGLDQRLQPPTSMDEVGFRAPRPRRVQLSAERSQRKSKVDLLGVSLGLLRVLEARQEGCAGRLKAACVSKGPGLFQQHSPAWSGPRE